MLNYEVIRDGVLKAGFNYRQYNDAQKEAWYRSAGDLPFSLIILAAVAAEARKFHG